MKLKTISINGAEIELSNLVIIVGQNGVGKTTLIRDLYRQHVNSNTNAVLGSHDLLWKKLLPDNYFVSSAVEWSSWYKQLQIVAGRSADLEHKYATQFSQSNSEQGTFLSNQEKLQLAESLNKKVSPDQLLGSMGRAFKSQSSTLLYVDTRLQFEEDGSVDNFKPASFLAQNPRILQEVNRHLTSLFGYKLFAEPHLFPVFEVCAGESNITRPTRGPNTAQGRKKDKLTYSNWKKQNDVQPIRNFGHGFRAAVQMLYSFGNPGNKIIFLDEPEVHLHPSIKYSLGTLISTYSNFQKQIILATHDIDMFKGLLRGSPDATIIKINKDKSVNVVSSQKLKKDLASDILQSIFADSLIVVEGISDEYVYSKSMLRAKLLQDMSIQFASVGGKDQLSAPCEFCDLMKINYAVIADLDFLIPIGEKRGKKSKYNESLGRILESKGVTRGNINKIFQTADLITESVKGQEVKINEIWGQLPQDQSEKLQKIIRELKEYGVFIVEVGDLEDWMGLPKRIPAEKVYKKYSYSPYRKYSAFTSFMGDIIKYIKNNSTTSAVNRQKDGEPGT